MCGSCHDIQNLQGAHVERTFQEWQGTLFSALPNGQGCADCHMKIQRRPRVDGVDEGAPAARARTSRPWTWRSRTFPRWTRSARRRSSCSTT